MIGGVDADGVQVSDVPTFEDGYRVQRFLSAIVESDERGESVTLG